MAFAEIRQSPERIEKLCLGAGVGAGGVGDVTVGEDAVLLGHEAVVVEWGGQGHGLVGAEGHGLLRGRGCCSGVRGHLAIVVPVAEGGRHVGHLLVFAHLLRAVRVQRRVLCRAKVQSGQTRTYT